MGRNQLVGLAVGAVAVNRRLRAAAAENEAFRARAEDAVALYKALGV